MAVGALLAPAAAEDNVTNANDMRTYYTLIAQHEGAVPYMYLDTAGYVTVGLGIMLPTAASASELPFKPYELARADWARVKRAKPAQHHSYYEALTTVRLSPAEIRFSAEHKIEQFLGHLRKLFPGFEKLSLSRRSALLDLAYNLGPAGLARRGELCDAVRGGDWLVAAQRSVRANVSLARNKRIYKLLLGE